jgi:biopolymer transport protein ExbD
MAKARKKKKTPEVSGTGTSDISFLLLCFFLMTSSMDESMGISRVLPPMPPDDQKPEDRPEVKEHNVLRVLVDGNDRISVNGRVINDLVSLKLEAKDFIANPSNDPKKSSKKDEVVPGFGSVPVSEAVISLQNVRGTSYETYIKVQDALTAAYNELRNEEALSRFGRKFEDLNEQQKDLLAKTMYKQKISEAPPKDIRKKK